MAEFPLRQLGGTPVGVAEDPSGKAWVLLSPGTIAETDGSNVLAEYQVPSYNGLAAAPVGSELGLITYDVPDKALWFYEAGSDVFGRLDPATGAISEFPLLPFTANPGIDQVMAGPDGNLYFTEPLLNEIGLFDIKAHLISQFTMPLADTQPQGITVGSDGNLWFSEGGQNKIASLNPISHVITNYAFEPASHTTNDQAEGITAGPNGSIWFVTRQNNLIERFDISSGTFSTFTPYWPPPPQNPPPPTPVHADLWSIALGPDSNIYYTEPAYGWVGFINPTNGAQSRVYSSDPTQGTAPEATLTDALIANGVAGSNLFVAAPSAPGGGEVYRITASQLAGGYGAAALPPVIQTDDANGVISVGGAVYFTDSTDGVGQIGKFDPVTLDYTVYAVPQLPPPPSPQGSPPRNQYPNQMTVDSNGNIWFTETNAYVPGLNPTGAIGELNPSTGAFTQSYLTSASTDPVGIAWDPQESQFWITEPGANQIVSFNPATSGSAVAPVAIPGPVGVLVDPNTGYLWITEGSADKIINYNPISEQILYTFNTKGSPNQLVWGPDGNIWFTEAGAVGVLTPPTGPGTGSIKAEIPVNGSANALTVGPSGGTYANTLWFTLAGSHQIGEINISTQALVGYATAPDSNGLAITLGPDGNAWFTSGPGTPPWLGAVVLNPNDLGTQVVVTTQPPNIEETTFGGFTYGFGLTVAVENAAGQIDPFVQQGTITISLGNDPGNGVLAGTLTVPVIDGVAVFDGLTIDAPGQGYTIQATDSLGLNTAVTNPFTVSGPATQLVVTAQPPKSVGAGLPFTVSVGAEDAGGLVVPTFVDPVLLSILANPPGIGVLNGTDPLGALYGTATFTDLSIDQAGIGYTLQAVDPSGTVSVTAATTAAFTVTAGPATQLKFAATGEPPGTATAGQDFATGTPIVVDAEDRFGYVDLTYSGPVAIALANKATGTLVGTLTVNAVKGVATFTDLEIDTAGTYSLQATSGTLTPDTSTPITIGPAAPARLAWATQPPGVVTQGIAFGATLDVEDQYGNAEPTSSQGVSVALHLNGNPAGGDLGGTTTVDAVRGVATFSNLIINAVGDPFTLVASGNGFTSPASAAIDVVAPQLVVTTQPTDATAGTGFTIAVTAETNLGAVDTGFTGTVALAIASGPTGATIQGTTSADISGGVATFNDVLLDTAGSYFLQASSSGATPGDSKQITDSPSATVAALVIEQEPPASVQAGVGFGLQVGAQDPYGNATALTGPVQVAISHNPGGATLGGSTTVIASGGTAKFGALSLDKVGTGYTLAVTSGSATPATTTGIDVTPAAAAQLAIPANGEPPSTVPAGQAFSLVVDVVDSLGNLVPTFQGAVSIAQPAGVTGTTTVDASGGVATFSGVVIDAAGTYQLQATSGTLSPATSTSVTVVAGSQPAQLVWAAEPPAHATRGVGFAARVAVEDQFGNLETGFTGAVTMAFGANPGTATLGGTSATVSAGVASFSALTISAVGNGYTLVAGAGGVSTPASTPIDVTQIPAVSLALTTPPPSSIQDTQSFGLAVTALDQAGNPDPDFNGGVTVSIVSPSGSTALSGTTTVDASGGVATFSGLDLQAIGGYTLQVTSNGLTPATTGVIDVAPGPAAQLVVTAQPPASVPAGNAFGFEVEVEDAFGYQATGFNGILTATLSSGPSGGSLFGTPIAQAGNGLAPFTGLSVEKAGGGYTLQVTGTGMTGTTTAAFAVTPAAPAQVTFSTPPPAQIAAGVPFSPSVMITDAYGNLETTYNSPVSVALANRQPAGALNGTLTRNASGGQVTFPGLTLDVASNYTIQATSGGLVAATSGTIGVVPAAATRLVISVPPPTSMKAGTQFGMAVAAEDPYGNVATGFNGSVTLALQGPSGPAGLGGGTSLGATGGVANFPPTLAIDTAGSGWTIQATSGGLTPASTAPITVTGLPSNHLAVLTQPPSTLAPGAAFGFVVAAVDQYNNVDPNFHGQIAIALASSSGATLGGTTSVTTSGGEASFQGLTLNGLTAPVTIVASAAGMPDVSTSSIGPTSPTSQGSSTTLVTMSGVQVVFKKNKVIGLTLVFSGGLNPSLASSTAEYQIIVAGKKNSFTVKNARKQPLLSAVYNAAAHSVALTLTKPLAVKKPVELVVLGLAPSGLQDSSGRLIDGNHDGQPGGNAVAVLSGKGKNVTAHPMAVTPATLDLLLEQGDLVAPRQRAH